MSGKYLHGLLIDNDFIDVRNNIFSHSELREKWTGSEQPHPRIEEWSWDFVTRQFVETKDDIIPIAQKWIDKNLATHEQLMVWINKNWEGLVNSDEKEREMYVWGLISKKATPKNKAVNLRLMAYVDKEKADDGLDKADAAWDKAYFDRKKAEADKEKADVDRERVDAAWDKAHAAWVKADVDRERVYVDWHKANVDLNKADKKWKQEIMKPIFMELLKKYPNEVWLTKEKGEKDER